MLMAGSGGGGSLCCLLRICIGIVKGHINTLHIHLNRQQQLESRVSFFFLKAYFQKICFAF